MIDSLCWLIRTLADVPESDGWLGNSERNRIAGMRFPKRRNEWRLGRWTAKLAVSAYLSGDAPLLSAMEVRAAPNGAPEVLLSGEPGPISISISHSHGTGFCVVGPRNFGVGCDIELVEPRADNFFDDYFTQEEISFLKQASIAERPLFATLIWSAKESTLKVLRQGLRRDTRSVAIDVDDIKQRGAWSSWAGYCRESSCTFRGWWRVCDEYVQTVAADHSTREPKELAVPDLQEPDLR